MTIGRSRIQCMSTGAVVNASLSTVKAACEVMVKISEAEEGLHILHFSQLRPILDYLNFCLVHRESLRRQNVPKVLYSLRVKLIFVGMGKKSMLAKVSEHFLDVFAVIHGIIEINEDVV